MPFQIIRNDITKMHTDAIVNTANPRPIIGSGTDSAIYEAAGSDLLLSERVKIGPIDRGQAAITPGFRLNAKYIIHTVGPKWKGGNNGEEALLRSCYENSLKLAVEYGCESISFPMISTGNYGFPKDLALQTVLSVVSKFLTKHDMMIYLVVFDEKSTKLSENLFAKIESRIDDEYAKQKAHEEYFMENASTPFFRDDRDKERREFYHRRREELDFDYDETPFGSTSTTSSSVKDDLWDVFQKFGYKKPKASATATSLDAEMLAMPSVSAAPKMSAVPKAQAAPKKRSLADLMKKQDESFETFQQMLLRLIDEKGLTGPQAYTRANQDKKLFSKIKNKPDYQPKKKTVFAFAIGLELSLDETVDLLASAGYAFAPGSKFDMIIQFCIEEKEYDIFNVETILYEYGQECLCNYS